MTTNPSIRSESTTSESRVTRFWRKRAGGPAPWAPGGWLPLLGLALLLVYGTLQTAPAIEAQTRDRVKSALMENGAQDVLVQVDGQEVLISAEGDGAYGAQLRAWASDVACSTWSAGEQICPNTVRVTTSGGATAVVPVASDRFHNFTLQESADALVLRGEVPDEATRLSLVSYAQRSYGSVVDELSVSNESATEAFDWALDRALPLLASVDTATVDWRDGSLSASGRIGTIDEASIRVSFSDTIFSDRLGELSLEPAANVSACNDRFASALGESQIQFETGSAAIAANSNPLLDRLATVAQDCPIRLVVAGHTDNVGNAELNQRLSFERATAVVTALSARGVSADRLSARGFGAEQPVASNRTPEGRASNRRIEITAVDGEPE